MKGSISFEKHRKAWAVWWYVAAKKRSVPLRYYYGVKLYNRELAEKLLALVQGTQEKAKRGECVFRIENFQRGASVDVVELFEKIESELERNEIQNFLSIGQAFRIAS